MKIFAPAARISGFLFGACLLVVGSALADEPRHGPEAIEVKVSAGTADGGQVFVPNELNFERGKYYKLLIHNPSSDEHYFTSEGLAVRVFTRKVEVMDKTGKTIVEVHGAVNDMELKPGATVAWYFYPMTKGERLPLYCHKAGHEEAGMVGHINITGPPPFSN